jgi:hypothetical protein
MDQDPRTIPAWTDPRFKEALLRMTVTLISAFLIGGRVLRIKKRLWLISVVVGVGYGYLMELDERRKSRSS